MGVGLVVLKDFRVRNVRLGVHGLRGSLPNHLDCDQITLGVCKKWHGKGEENRKSFFTPVRTVQVNAAFAC